MTGKRAGYFLIAAVLAVTAISQLVHGHYVLAVFPFFGAALFGTQAWNMRGK